MILVLLALLNVLMGVYNLVRMNNGDGTDLTPYLTGFNFFAAAYCMAVFIKEND